MRCDRVTTLKVVVTHHSDHHSDHHTWGVRCVIGEVRPGPADA
jgi:hypothetical protein